NLNQLTIKLHVNDHFITLLYTDLHHLKQLQQCIDSHIVEKQKKLVSYQSTFDTSRQQYSTIIFIFKILTLACVVYRTMILFKETVYFLIHFLIDQLQPTNSTQQRGP
ncbi:Uncharacterized protein FWK35_00024539, partial [Aphis craccivora]